MTERRFSDDEVATIFQRAAEAQPGGHQRLPSSEGMTLAQLQEIGREAGIAPEQVARAANALELEGRSASRQFLGFPIGVGTTVDLGRVLTDAEWERVVVDLRETFDAKGTLSQQGSFRQWTNGNLQALLEPTATGHRLRLRTTKGDARPIMFGGLLMMAGAGVAAAIELSGGPVHAVGALESIAALAAAGAGVFGFGGLRLPGWARQRRRQMEEVAARTAALAATPPADRLPGG